MTGRRSAGDWDNVRLRCQVIGCALPGLVAIAVDPEEPPFDEELLHYDTIGCRVLSLVGRQVQLHIDFVPAEKRFPHASLSLCLHGDGSWAVYEDSSSAPPLSRWARDPSR